MLKQLSTKLLMIAAIVLCGVTTAFAQGGAVTGVVTDAADGSFLPGATVVVKGTTQGTVTDINGNYSIEVNPSQVLEFSYVGYAPQEFTVQPGTFLNVALQSSAQSLEGVVIIGYGTVKKNDLTGSVSVISTKDFNRGNITTPQELLIGKSAGVVINENSGAPGSGATIRIRGGSSLNASNDPLIIVDGMPISNNDISGSSNFLSFINPNDIETFTVLKDASATAIYGSRASNGVILITTKRSKAGSALKLTYNGSVSISTPIKLLDVYSGDQIRQIANEKDIFTPESYANLGSENTNWQKEIFRTAISQNHNIGFSGAYKTLPYRVSIGYTDQNGILKNTDMRRITGTVNLNPTFFNNSLKVNINAKGMSSNNNFGDSGAVGSSISMDPSHPVMDGNAASAGYFQWGNYGANLGTPNPVEQAMAVDNKSTVNRLIGNIQLDYTLPFFKDINANLNLATDYTKSEGHNNRPTTSPSVLTSPFWGSLTDYNAKNTNNLLEFYLNYKKDLAAISSKFDATVGYSWQHFYLENYNYHRGIYDDAHPYQIPSDSATHINELYLVSFFGRLNYTFKDKYLLTFTLRDDGSSRFSSANRWGIFPAAAFAWKINDEAFMKDVKFLSDLKLRLGWGVTGQQDIGSYYPYMATYTSSSDGSYYLFNGEYISTLRPEAYDPNIKWESTTTQNVGLDFGFAHDRITGSIDLYKRVTDDLLNRVTIPTGSNFSNTLYTNVGSLENKGVELGLNLIPISKSDMSLNVGFNFTYNQNKITKLLNSDDPNYIGILYGDAFTGVKQVTRVGYAAYSYFVNQQVYDANGNPIEGMYVDLSGDGGVVNGDNADKYIYHNPVPDYLMGLSLRFTYKNFDASTSTRLSLGNYVYNQIAAGASYDQMYQIGYWHNEPTSLSNTNFVKRQFTSDYFVENASFFKMDNLSVGYQINNIAKKLNAHVSFTVQNVFTITDYSGIDPEVPGGIDNNFYPRSRTFMLGVSLGY